MWGRKTRARHQAGEELSRRGQVTERRLPLLGSVVRSQAVCLLASELRSAQKLLQIRQHCGGRTRFPHTPAGPDSPPRYTASVLAPSSLAILPEATLHPHPLEPLTTKQGRGQKRNPHLLLEASTDCPQEVYSRRKRGKRKWERLDVHGAPAVSRPCADLSHRPRPLIALYPSQVLLAHLRRVNVSEMI